MAAAKIPAPGTRLGPCIDACGHQDCAAARRHAAMICKRCSEPIGYEQPYYWSPSPPAASHASCCTLGALIESEATR